MAAIGTRFWCPLMYRSRIRTTGPVTAGSHHNLLDYNPDTIYIGSNPSICGAEIDIDTQNNFGFAIRWAGVFLRNGSDMSNTLRLIVYGSNDYNNWGSAKINTGYTISAIKNYPLIIRAMSEDYALRYWKFDLIRTGEIIEAGMFMLGIYYDVDVRWNWQSPLDRAQYLDMIQTFGGRFLTRLGNDKTFFIYRRHYEMISDNDMLAIRSMFRACRAGAYPIMMTDDIPATGWDPNSLMCNSRTSRLVRLIPERDEYGHAILGQIPISAGLWNVTLTLVEEVWTGEGRIN